MGQPWRDEQKLRSAYEQLGYDQSAVADEFGCSTQTICHWMNRLDIEVEERRLCGKINNEDWLREQYWGEGKSLRQIAEEVDVSANTVRNRFAEFGIEMRDKSSAAFNRCSRDGVPYHVSDGYCRWGHGYQGKQLTVQVHRLLAVAEFGFDSVEGHHVHHENGVKWDNRSENIELVTPSEHARLHHG